ncbi:1-deoxy-D-xylulose-5-phosphate synthase [Clostridium homopropionicum DSM 5847]|uniref:1-deoxy-D-xylulose-5-phosphate synthase n=1 Tax=Clostridium homopropionicum DSM 5847 TaxID=1121318 RepID=A0A0L6ZD88_9CLOT|nr:1-deoxy-D-xylulose-5-phosphate synthase [Clostridium homopropionicum]KOA20935.1 1-deoxy-D-xylulose-5-phosphate synthase [Clostridium homopropionicum DSM 5847]SFG01842.1 1-deoxy-D-xylulose-5-phosphate synthase [Clostridium homopropionicum]
MYNILNNYNDLDQLKKMSFGQIYDFSDELRNFLIEKVSKTGGHLASNLGVVELTLSLYRVFDLNKDKIIWDVGHQTYVHKILTGRKDKFDNLRRHGGISGFPKCCESKYDLFETGHSSTSISAALGMARARDLTDEKYQVVAVIGDGALTGGMALEALNDVGYRKTNLIIVLNDNQMSIGKNVGGLSTYLSKIRIDPKYNKFKFEFNEALRKTNLGNGLADSLKKIKSGIKQILVPGMFFEDMGIKYLGPIDGHNIKEMTKVMSMAKDIKGPVLIHTITKKGKGYIFAENNPDKFHGVSTFDWMTGKTPKSSVESYSETFGDAMVEIASDDDKVVAITAAMKDGTGLTEFAAKFPKRFFDVGIAEQHAVTLAAGMSKGGLKPVFVVYSTFLQRAYDQVIHDVCQQKLPVVFAIDRAGIVGNDGETHQGVFDLSYLSHMPNITIMSPKSTEELKYMLKWSVNQKCPIAIRYPRGGDNVKIHLKPLNDFIPGKWEVINNGGKVALIATGKMVQIAMEVQHKLKNNGIETTLVNACFVKPIDKNLLKNLLEQNYKIITIEDNVLHGGLGSLVLEYANLLNYRASITNYGFEDKFISHGDVDVLYKLYGLDSDGLVEKIIKII